MDRAIEAVSRFAAIDGALLLDSQLDVLAIGAIVTRRGKLPRHVQVADVAAGVHREVPVQSLGGTRHQSGAAFCAQTPESMAVVVSQDGSVTLLMREREQQDVQAVRHAEGGLYWRSLIIESPVRELCGVGCGQPPKRAGERLEQGLVDCTARTARSGAGAGRGGSRGEVQRREDVPARFS
jgi:hypothetical protein